MVDGHGDGKGGWIMATEDPASRSRPARDLGYNLVGLPLGIAAFAVSVAGFAGGGGHVRVSRGIAPPILADRAPRCGEALDTIT